MRRSSFNAQVEDFFCSLLNTRRHRVGVMRRAAHLAFFLWLSNLSFLTMTQWRSKTKPVLHTRALSHTIPLAPLTGYTTSPLTDAMPGLRDPKRASKLSFD